MKSRSVLRRGIVAVVLALVMLPATQAIAQEQQQQQRRKWWLDEKLKAELGLSAQQSADVEAAFQGAIPKLKAAKEQLDVLEAELSRLIRERVADEQTVAAQVDRVEAARAELSKARTLMLYRMHRILSPEQNARLQEMHDRWQKERRSRRPDSR